LINSQVIHNEPIFHGKPVIKPALQLSSWQKYLRGLGWNPKWPFEAPAIAGGEMGHPPVDAQSAAKPPQFKKTGALSRKSNKQEIKPISRR
jgi:hypothetical protein